MRFRAIVFLLISIIWCSTAHADEPDDFDPIPPDVVINGPLAGIDAISLEVTVSPGAREAGFSQAAFAAAAVPLLEKAGIAAAKEAKAPRYVVFVDAAPRRGLMVVQIRGELYESADVMRNDRKVPVRANTWSATADYGVTSAESAAVLLHRSATGKVEQFVAAWTTANRPTEDGDDEPPDDDAAKPKPVFRILPDESEVDQPDEAASK